MYLTVKPRIEASFRKAEGQTNWAVEAGCQGPDYNTGPAYEPRASNQGLCGNSNLIPRESKRLLYVYRAHVFSFCCRDYVRSTACFSGKKQVTNQVKLLNVYELRIHGRDCGDSRET